MLTNCYEKVAITSYRRKSTERYRCKQGSTLRLQCQRLPPDIIHIYAVIALSLIIFSAGWPLSATASSLTAADHQRMQPESLDYAEDDEIKTGDDDDDDEDNMGEYLLDHVAPTSLPENSEAEAVGDDGVSKTMPGPAMPQYMIDLYRKFASDRYSTPIANTVRSFTGVLTEDDVTRSEATGSDPDTVVEFLIVFNLSSVYRSEEIHLAELHLGDSLLFDSHLFPVPVRSRRLRVTVFEHYILATRDVTLADKTFKIGDKDDIKAELTFSVTDTVQRWVRHDQLHQQHASSLSSSVTSPTSNGGFRVRFEVMVDPNPSLTESLEQADGHLSSENQSQNQQPPLLVVFSDDRKRREAEERERHEIESHELEAIQTDAADLHSEVDAERVEGNTVDETDNEIDGNVSEDLTRRRRRKRRASYAKQEPLSGSDNQTTQTVSEDNAAAKLVNDFKPDGGNQFAVRNRGARRRVAGSQQRKPVEDRRRNAASKTTTSSGSRRNSCRRRPLYVDFAEIRWDRWIIAPKGYQAYECVGQCRFPLSDHLTPTKYALIKSLVNTVHGPSRAGPVCCIPTKLEPISILYVDERGTVTYKYRYDGMVVAECGCR